MRRIPQDNKHGVPIRMHERKYQEYLDAIPDPVKLDEWHQRWDHFRF